MTDICYKKMPVTAEEPPAPRHSYVQCCCCQEWVTDWFEQRQIQGIDGMGRWHCRKCFVEKRKPTLGLDAEKPQLQMPPEYITASLADLPGPKRQPIYAWPNKPVQLLILGCEGSGKTRLCWAFKKILYGKKMGCLYVYAPDARSEWSTSLYRRELEKKWATAERLILDGVSSCSKTDAWTERLEILLSLRLQENKPTIITSTARPDQLENLYTREVCSRLSQFAAVELPAKDWRKRKGDDEQV